MRFSPRPVRGGPGGILWSLGVGQPVIQPVKDAAQPLLSDVHAPILAGTVQRLPLLLVAPSGMLGQAANACCSLHRKQPPRGAFLAPLLRHSRPYFAKNSFCKPRRTCCASAKQI